MESHHWFDCRKQGDPKPRYDNMPVQIKILATCTYTVHVHAGTCTDIHVQLYLYFHASNPIYRSKHPTEVHVWAGISVSGQTGICIFEDTINKEPFVKILHGTLLPLYFITEVYLTRHKFMQDNDPKHTSGYADQWLTDNGVIWWKTPAESPDINLIENLA